MPSVGTVISYPIPAYQNLPIRADFYQPHRFVISAVTLGQTTIITTTEDHDYLIGQQVRLIIPYSFGCIELNAKTGFVLSIPTTTSFELDIYSLHGNAYIASSSTVEYAQTVAIGDINSGQINNNGNVNQITYIDGSFINISPL